MQTNFLRINIVCFDNEKKNHNIRVLSYVREDNIKHISIFYSYMDLTLNI